MSRRWIIGLGAKGTFTAATLGRTLAYEIFQGADEVGRRDRLVADPRSAHV
jgi:hypothetical protein